MTAFAEDRERRSIPRWRFSHELPRSAELEGDPRATKRFVPDLWFLDEKIAAWKSSRTIATAADLIACGAVLGQKNVVLDAALFLLERSDDTPSHLRRLAEFVTEPAPSKGVSQIQLPLGVDTQTIARATVREQRTRLHVNPRNLMAWLDLSRAYTILGQHRQAVIAMENALRLAPNHRYALRAASRLFVHTGDSERAHILLCNNIRTKYDPWLMAAEISVAMVAERHPKFFAKARNLAQSKSFPPSHMTELHSALGTLDWRDGRVKKARRSFRDSLVAPTDNAVAQARWIRTKMSGVVISAEAWQVPRSFEARCWRALDNESWSEAVNECQAWLWDEPFSSRPATLGSYIGVSLVSDYQFAEGCARAGLLADPTNQTLRNNLAVSLAYQGRLSDAQTAFEQIKLPPSDTYPAYIYAATAGLLEFRNGRPMTGCILYEKAEELAPRDRKHRVLIFWAREEILSKTDASHRIFQRAVKESSNSKDPQTMRLLKLLKDEERTKGNHTVSQHVKGDATR